MGPKMGLFFSSVRIGPPQGLMRVFRDWLKERAGNYGVIDREEEDKRLLWADTGKQVGLKMRVMQRSDIPAPMEVEEDEDKPVSYTLQYEELVVKATKLLLMVEQSIEDEANHSGLFCNIDGVYPSAVVMSPVSPNAFKDDWFPFFGVERGTWIAMSLGSKNTRLKRNEPNTAYLGVTVDLGYSKYQGATLGNGVIQWLGIRFAAPPIGDLRFRDAQDPEVNSTLIIADEHGPLCLPTPSTGATAGASEDCLFLDVYAPSNDDMPHPVFVFIQGGGFNTNANGNMNGSSLIVAGGHDIIVVTFNYRVGPWGFLASEEVQENGDLNVGLKDQRKVFEWVQKYIYLFGGDPNHVTIGGDSAGAASVALHLSAYGGRNDGLFHAAVAESQSFGAQLNVSESQYQYDGLVQRTGCANSTDTLKCLRSLDISVITANNIYVPTPGGGNETPVYMYSNVIDEDFTPDYTYSLYAKGKFIKVPVIFGDDTNEGTIFTPQSIDNYTAMDSFLLANWIHLTPAQLWMINSFYPPAETFPDSGRLWRTASNAYGDIRYNCPGIFISSASTKFSSLGSWNYHWNVLDPAYAASGLGVVHVAELASIWGASSSPDSELTPAIQGYWTSFIRRYDPNVLRPEGMPIWEKFQSAKMAGGQRLLFPNDPSAVAMETVPDNLATRCAYLSGIGVSLRHPRFRTEHQSTFHDTIYYPDISPTSFSKTIQEISIHNFLVVPTEKKIPRSQSKPQLAQMIKRKIPQHGSTSLCYFKPFEAHESDQSHVSKPNVVQPKSDPVQESSQAQALALAYAEESVLPENGDTAHLMPQYDTIRLCPPIEKVHLVRIKDRRICSSYNCRMQDGHVILCHSGQSMTTVWYHISHPKKKQISTQFEMLTGMPDPMIDESNLSAPFGTIMCTIDDIYSAANSIEKKHSADGLNNCQTFVMEVLGLLAKNHKIRTKQYKSMYKVLYGMEI
ncbi:Carboxylesterase [Chlorociboria aeruginascens]|nr:Carboxylesterase [Chlorociboria aeruginascens]